MENIKLTKLEKELMEVFNKPNGNRYNMAQEENFAGEHSEYYNLATMFFNHDKNVTKGVVGSLVKKGIITTGYDTEEREETICLTEKGLKYYE